MKTMRRIAGAAAVWMIAAALASGATVKLGAGSKLWLEGQSTLHPYEAKATQLDFALSLQAAAPVELPAAVRGQAPASLTLKIPVTSLKSEHKGLDSNLQKALKADKNPDITFTLEGYRVQTSSGVETVGAWGPLTIAGVTKPEQLTATLKAADGSLVLDGEKALLMTDFGVKPPTMMMGTIKTEDRVVVKFHLELGPDAQNLKSNGK